MEIFFANQPVKITVPLLTSSGVVVTDAIEASYRVINAKGEEVVPSTELVLDEGAPSVEIDIPAEANELEEGKVRAYRQVEVQFSNATHRFQVFEEYLIEAADSLVVTLNSFQTYPDALVLAAETTGLDEFMGATRRDRMAALINAHSVLSRLRYQVIDSEFMRDSQRHIRAWAPSGYVNLTTITPERFATLPDHFVRAITIAQLIEANEALDQFSIHRKRQSGLMSETIGESSMMFRSEKVLNIPVTRRSLDMLRPYLDWGVSLGRG